MISRFLFDENMSPEYRHSMPRHLSNHLASGGHVLAIFTLRPESDFGQIIEDLILFAEVAREEEHLDQIIYLPL